MSFPPNPLDKFITYTYHFELHGASTWDELKVLDDQTDKDSGGNATTPFEGNGTLLINTRKDAHQTIDNVKFAYGAPQPQLASTIAPEGISLTLDVYEPAGMFFAQKIRNQYKKYDSENFTLIFALRIFFVGQTVDGRNVTEQAKYIIPLSLRDMRGEFTHTGGHYLMVFTSYSNTTPSQNGPDALSFSASFINRAISISATTVRGALEQLEKKLNENYEKTYKTTNSDRSAGSDNRSVGSRLVDKFLGRDTLVRKDVPYATLKERGRVEPSVGSKLLDKLFKREDGTDIRADWSPQNQDLQVGKDKKLKPLRYVINVDEKIPDGMLNTTSENSTQPGDNQKMTLDPNQTVQAMIHKILFSSKEINDMVASSRSTIKTEFQRGVKYPTIKASMIIDETEAVLLFDIRLYEGDSTKRKIYEFEYFFSDAGTNVDVMNFNVVFPNLATRFVTLNNDSLDLFTNLNGRIPQTNPDIWAGGTCYPDVTRSGWEGLEQTTVFQTGSSGDIAWLPLMSKNNMRTNPNHDAASASSYHLAFDTLKDAAMLDTEFTFQIRGNLDILEDCITYPTMDDKISFGIEAGTWIKVNIHSLDENNKRVPFYYGGYYQLDQVECVFSQGIFIQFLKMALVSPPKENTQQVSVGASEAVTQEEINRALTNPKFENTPAGAATALKGRFTKRAPLPNSRDAR